MPQLTPHTFGNARRRRVVLERETPSAKTLDLTDEPWVPNVDPNTGQKRFAHAPASAHVCATMVDVAADEQWKTTVRISGSKDRRLTFRLASITGVIVFSIRPQISSGTTVTRVGEFTV